jgi:osmoprotectant transport system substrate-binding protein
VNAIATNPEIERGDLLVLRDDKGMIGPENITPVVRSSLLRGPRAQALRRQVNAVSAVLTTERLRALNLQVADGRDPVALAGEFVETFRVVSGPRSRTSGPLIEIGHQDFEEQEILANVYGEALTGAGFRRKVRRIGATPAILRSMRAGGTDLFLGYANTLLKTLQPSARPSRTGLPGALRRAVARRLPARATSLAPGQDANAFVMLRATAQLYGIKKLSDLTRYWAAPR